MMSFYGQRLANKFPLWSKVRIDPSSLGQRIFSSFGDYFEQSTEEKVQLAELKYVLPKRLGLESIQTVVLEEENFISTTNVNGRITPIFPSISATRDSSTITPTYVSTVEEFLNGLPSSITVNNLIIIGSKNIWTSSVPTIFNSINPADYLVITISNSTNYKRVTINSEELFGGITGLKLYGRDQNYQEFYEFIPIIDDGIYITHNIFQTLLSVEYDGFDGDIEINLTTRGSIYIKDPFRLAVTPELEGPLRLSINSNNSYTFLEYATPLYLTGQEYRRTDSNILDEEITEIIAQQVLLNQLGDSIVPIDLAISPSNTKLYVLDTSNQINIFTPGVTEFIPPSESIDETTYISLVPLKNRVLLDETIPLWTWFHTLRAPVVHVTIYIVSPDGTKYYLQDDRSWSTIFNNMSGTPIAGLPEDTWSDIKFNRQFNLLGQWDLYCNVRLRGLDDSGFTSHTAIMCESLQAERTFSTDLIDLDGIYFGHNGLLYVTSGNTAYPITQHRDVYMIDLNQQTLYFHDVYSEVQIGD